jgi:hypothetical protein
MSFFLLGSRGKALGRLWEGSMGSVFSQLKPDLVSIVFWEFWEKKYRVGPHIPEYI